MASYMTVLRAPTPQQATKTARLVGDRWVTKPQGKCKQFTPVEVEVTAIDDVAGVIELVREEDRRGLLIAGRLTDRVRAKLESMPDLRIFRRGTAGHGENGTIEDLPRDWVVIDIDSWVLPPGADLVNAPEAVIRAAVHDLLPPAFHGVRAFWQLSSSAGFKNGILKAHVFYWLSEAVSNAHLKLVLQQHAPLLADYSAYHAMQAIYIQDPIVVAGIDPLPRRTGWLDGSADAVVLPRPMPVPAVVRNRVKRVGAVLGGGIGVPGEPMARLGDGPGLNGFHEPLRTATMRYAYQCIEGKRVRNDAALKAKLRSAIFAAPYHPSTRTPADLQDYASDQTLDGLIDGAFHRARTTAAMPEVMAPEYGLPQRTPDEARREVGKEEREFLRIFNEARDKWAAVRQRAALSEGRA